VTVNDGTWLRIIDLPAALRARAYNGRGSLVFEAADEFCPSNAGRWQLDVPGDGTAGTATVGPAPQGVTVDLSLDVGALAAVYLGAFRFGDLARAGRAQECRPGALARADTLFTTGRAPSNATMF
jgi:predicted acetyltransferase